ncbi:hypothetical protein METBIDRAFT_12608 [Metschnikowia bicuspidata var. bicuspidata NRRL YB-4993]|uniref:Uncharacterized protein n=1 Tax=Metschnikowia bicuspidata var. bicuspidata NRRL YB-4993 TaxID=869754 RepID=A0A1A0H9S8_9ASCO|nr:hypothetical protein METBIDRAFT_12608 [Metschnikowia bicuspidata var. bicuspidata NRRL YB-4993]OBA20637.1 hypothetical protein METBIDRAFT_12608 [Metschnikowia bicuspidata var. bicuspidata NRRL YB-4993]
MVVDLPPNNASHSDKLRAQSKVSPGGSRKAPAPILADSPVLQQKPLCPTDNHNSLSGASTRKSILPAISLGVLPVRRSGSPERRLRIKELELKLPHLGPLGLLDSKHDLSNKRTISHGQGPGPAVPGLASPEKNRKRARFAIADLQMPLEDARIPTSPQIVADSLDRISNTLSATAVALRDIKNTQQAILAEILQLKQSVRKLEKQSEET